jgi:acyl carrier protein
MNTVTPSRESLFEIIYQSIDDVNQQLAPEQQIVKLPDTSLFDSTHGLDSLTYVTLVALIEEKCEDRFGVSVSLSEDNAGESFETIESLVSFLELRLNTSH